MAAAPRRRAAAPELTGLEQAVLVRALRSALATATAAPVPLIETHISWVLLCAGQAYKFKKALKTPFLDQSTRARRRRFCGEELRLNRRLAPTLYLDALPITGRTDAPHLGGDGPALDWVVHMRAFDPAGLWDVLAARGALSAGHIDELVAQLVPFHAAAAAAGPHGRLGTPGQVCAVVRANLRELAELADDGGPEGALPTLLRWEAAAARRLRPVLAQRLAQGRVRECHGDLHLGNVTLFDGRTTVFDGIDFNPALRWIDVASELAFMAMDLQAHGLAALAHRFVNGYLERSGDYAGAELLDYYLLHRALVRAKVALLRRAQCRVEQPAVDAAKTDHTMQAAARYMSQAVKTTRPRRPALVLTHGCSGSGKTWLTQDLLEQADGIRIRADVERKRLAGLAATARGTESLYSASMTAATYARLLELAAPVLRGGRHVILDATFLQRAQRDAAYAFARQAGVEVVVLDFTGDPEVLRRRVRQRSDRGGDASDADEAVLSAQLRSAQALQADEQACVLSAPPLQRVEDGQARADWTAVLARLG